MKRLCVLIICLLLGCGSNKTVNEFSTPYSVGTMTFELMSEGRIVPVQLWYPSKVDESLIGLDVLETGESRNTLRGLIETLDNPCPRTQITAAVNSKTFVVDTPRPVVLFSHCHSCSRLSSFSSAYALAQQGYIVAAPDHVGGTIFDELEDMPGPLNAEFLQTRGADISNVLDAILQQIPQLPQNLNPDPENIGIFGHSFGAVTTGLVLQRDARFKAGVAIAAPIENPLIPGVSVDAQQKPILYLIATEDNSITEIGNQFMRDNYAAHPVEAWKIEVQDAGHWSFSDICGLTPDLMPGCGSAPRQTDRTESVTYMDNDRARSLAAHTVLSFFNYQLLADEDARSDLSDGFSDEKVSVMHHDGMTDSE